MNGDEHPASVGKGSASFPYTGQPCSLFRLSNTQKLGARFQPMQLDSFLKSIEGDESSPCSIRKSKPVITEPKQIQDNCSDLLNSDDESTNILDTTILEDDSYCKNKELTAGITWLKETPKKHVCDTPISDMFKKISISDKENEKRNNLKEVIPQVNPFLSRFRTPLNKISRPVIQQSVLSSTKTLINNQNKLQTPASVKQLEHPEKNVTNDKNVPRITITQPTARKMFMTPRREIPPVLNIQASVNRHRNTQRNNMHTPHTAAKNTCASTKKSDTVLRDQNVNIQLENQKPSVDVEKYKITQQNAQCIPKQPQKKMFSSLMVHGKEYTVINKLGEGGSCQVFKCLEQETLQDRAIKIVNLAVDATTATGYINEVKMLRNLQGNDRVIKMFDYEQIQQTLFVVMEKGDIDFSVFLRTIATDNQVPTHIIVCYWIEMLKCVKEIHDNGIIHSDLKPSNFLIVGGRLKLIDFGISSSLSSDMTSIIKSVLVGSFNYISPEALLDSKENTSPDDGKPRIRISYKSDVWSLGCILYEMVYKKTPFHYIEKWAKIIKIIDKNHTIEYPPVNVPVHLIEMIKKCLRYEMNQRPTVQDLLTMYSNGNYF